jgi:very-short-patch-repair endonuclease
VDTLDPVTLLHRLGGVSDGTTLRRGCDPEALKRTVREGRVLHLGRNTYALPGADAAITAAIRLQGASSHLSAARAWGWKVKRLPATPVVTVPRNRKVDASRRDGVDLRWAHLPSAEVDDHRTSRLRTVVDCARSLPFDEALCVADSALREGRVTREDLVAAAARSPRTGRATAVRVAGLADGRAANPFESCLRAIALDVEGLTVTPQLAVPGIGHADLGDAALRLLVEADSFEFHALREAFTYDIRRYTAMVRAGWTVLRFCWEDVMQRPQLVRDTLVDVVRLQRRAVRRCRDCAAA